MKKSRILLVEDDRITAKLIRKGLEEMGYHVYDPVATGEEAIEKVRSDMPDLVLMDIGLAGEMDGIEASKVIENMFEIPIIFLTADDNRETIERAKTAGSFGYIIKPFKINELHSSIQMAIYKDNANKMIRESQQWLSTTLKSIGEAVIAADKSLNVKFLNKTAMELTGWSEVEAIGKPLDMVCSVVFENEEMNNNSKLCIRDLTSDENVEGKHFNALLCSRKGNELYIDFNISPIRDEKNDISGYVCVFKDITDKLKLQKQLQRNIQEAAVFQKKLIPREIPKDTNLFIEAMYIPSQNVGGDIYDFYKIGDYLILFIADVCGHGVPAAMMSSYLKAEFKQYINVSGIIEPDVLLNRIKDDIKSENLLEGKFVTSIICQIDLKRMTLKYANAGHCPMLLWRNKDVIEIGNGEEIIIADYANSNYNLYEYKLEKGDALLLYTDGIYEWIEDRKVFGLENFKTYLKNNDFTWESVNKLINRIGEKELIQDDISCILINF